jgi:hypothetical protein
MIDWFKTMTTNAYIRGVKQSAWPPFPGRLWLRYLMTTDTPAW